MIKETFVSFYESDQGQYIGTWTPESCPNSFLRRLAEEAIRTGEPAQDHDDYGCLVTARLQEYVDGRS